MRANKGIFWNTLGSTMYGLNSFLMLALVSRFCTVAQTGAFGIAFTTAQMLYIVGLFGTSHYQMTDYKKVFRFSDYARARAVSCGVMLAACAGAVVLLDFSREKALLTVLLAGNMLLNLVGDLYQNLFFQNQRLDLSGSALFYRTLWPLAVFCLVLPHSLVWAIAAQTLCNLAVTGFYICRRAPAFLALEPRREDRGAAGKLLRECAPLFTSLLLMNLVINASKYGIEFLMDDTAQGYFNMIFMPAQVINLCSQFVFKPMLGRYAQLLNRGEGAAFRRLLNRQLGLVAAFTMVCCLGTFFLGTPVLGLLYGVDLSGQRTALTWVVFGGGIYAACQLMYYVFVTARQQGRILRVYVLGTVVCLPVTWGLIQLLGITGAALAFAVVHGAVLAVYKIQEKRCF